MYNRKDYYYKKAKEEGRASRASYKLEQIQAKFKVIKKGDVVLDLGCAPGGWLEVLSDMVGSNGLVVGIDILPLKIQLYSNIRYIQGDITRTDEMLNVIPAKAGISCERDPRLRGDDKPCGDDVQCVFDSVFSDMAPNTSGVAFKDAYLSYELCLKAFDLAKSLLKDGGHFVAKIFQGEEVSQFKTELARHFKKVEQYTPPATREGSKELYLIALNHLTPLGCKVVSNS